MSIPGNANPLLLATAADGAAAADTAKSLRFNSGDSAKLTRTPSSAGNRKTWTYSVWLKRSKLGGYASILGTSNDNAGLRFDPSTNRLELFEYSGSYVWQLLTDQRFRDVSSWYHIVFALDTTQATAANRAKLYVNGTQVTQFTTSNYPAQNYQGPFNNNTEQSIGDDGAGHASHFDGYLANVYFIDGLALAPTSFGAFDNNGVWQAAEYSGTFGTNGFHLLDFANESTIGHDSSGNENDWTANNFSTTAGVGNDVLFDFPANGSQSDGGNGGEVSGNYCTLNPLDSNIGSNLTNGNLDAAGSSNWSAGHARATFGLTSGKWYWEVTRTGGSGATAQIGFCNKAFDLTTSYGSLPADSWTFAFGNGTEILRPSGGGTGYFTGSAMGVGDTVGIALDMDAKTAVFYKNGTAGASISLSSTKTSSTDNIDELFPLVGVYNANVAFNGGQRAFAYTAPSGYKALCTTNLSTPTIADGSDYFDIDLYTGTGSSHERSEFSFSPDFVWIKSRSNTRYHNLYDIVRGANKYLSTNVTTEEGTATQELMSFDSDGFTVGTAVGVNESSQTYCAWAWDGGSSTASNTDGSISANVRANASAGFSIIEATVSGSGTIGHGLNAKPHMVFRKRTDGTSDWYVAVDTGSVEGYLLLNSTAAITSESQGLTSSVFTAAWLGNSGEEWINYAFAPVAGYSAFGTYSGNGSSDGPFIYTGFKPRWVMYKRTDATADWEIKDSARDAFNPTDNTLIPNTNGASYTGYAIDILSNGFKPRTSGNAINNSGGTYVYAAFSENAFSLNGGLAR